jgi:hypothetical protein
MFECEFCKKVYSSKSNLTYHKKTTKSCLALRENVQIEHYKCSYCEYYCENKNNTKKHELICKLKPKPKSYEILSCDYENSMKIIEELKIQNKDLQDRIQYIAEKAIEKSWQTIIEIEEETETAEEHTDEEYELVPLELDNGYIIESREEDSYIDVTNLCKAGKKEFKHWKSLNKTKSFLHELASKVGIPTVELITQNTGGNGDRHTWVHPQVAINIAQWISPQFDVKVSAWVLEVMMTGKIDITNTKSYRELKEDNKNKQLKIQLMTKKYVKKQHRIQYEEKNVIYILTTANMKKERRYILGKATNLTSRLSVYNKSDEHEVVYYQECINEERMSVVETLVFCKLNQYREQANRERFLLPEGTSINLFSDTIRDCIEFIK